MMLPMGSLGGISEAVFFNSHRFFKNSFIDIELVDLQCSVNVYCAVMLYPFVFFSIRVYHRLVDPAPCLVQQDLVVCLLSVC